MPFSEPVPPLAPMVDLRLAAHALAVEPIDLVRELQSDAVPMIKVSSKRWRVAESDFAAWRAKRLADAATEAAQARKRAQHVAGAVAAAPAPKRKARFRR